MCLRRFRLVGLSVARYQWRVSNDAASVFARDDGHFLVLTMTISASRRWGGLSTLTH